MACNFANNKQKYAKLSIISLFYIYFPFFSITNDFSSALFSFEHISDRLAGHRPVNIRRVAIG